MLMSLFFLYLFGISYGLWGGIIVYKPLLMGDGKKITIWFSWQGFSLSWNGKLEPPSTLPNTTSGIVELSSSIFFSNQNNIKNKRFLFSFFPYGSEKITNIFTNTTSEKIANRFLGKEHNFCLIKRWKLCFVGQSPTTTSILIKLKIVFWSHLRKICMTTLEISKFHFCFIYCIDSWWSIWSICMMRSEFGLIYRI